MILGTVKKSRSAQIDLTPLINIIFLILIFFMLAGSIKPTDLVQAARIESGAAVDAQLLIIAIDVEGVVQIEGKSFSDESLLALLREHRAKGNNIGVKPDGRLQAARLVEISAVVQQAGFSELTLITRNR